MKVDSAPAIPGSRNYTGIDLFRIIAAFGVIYIHSPLTITRYNVSPIALQTSTVFSFAVPFFLLTSFFLAIRSERANHSFQVEVGRRTRRLLLPYLVWSVIYLTLKYAKYMFLHRSVQFILHDPVSILLGGTAVHLYFIPLLFVGLMATWAINTITVNRPNSLIVLYLSIALLLKFFLHKSGNDFNLMTMRAFETSWNTRQFGLFDAVLRIVLVITAHTIRCLPLIMIAFFLRSDYKKIQIRFGKFNVLCFSFILCCLTLTGTVRITPFSDEVLGLSVFLLALAVSAFISNNVHLSNLGAMSYGIYLLHQIILEMLQFILGKTQSGSFQESPFSLIIISAVTFAIAFLTLTTSSRINQKFIRMK